MYDFHEPQTNQDRANNCQCVNEFCECDHQLIDTQKADKALNKVLFYLGAGITFLIVAMICKYLFSWPEPTNNLLYGVLLWLLPYW